MIKLREYAVIIVVSVLIGAAVAFGLSRITPRSAPSAPPSPAITGSYSTAGLSGMGCKHTGPGWLIVPTGVAGEIYHVKDAYYCTISTGAAVIPFAGKPFSLYYPFQFSKKAPG